MKKIDLNRKKRIVDLTIENLIVIILIGIVMIYIFSKMDIITHALSIFFQALVPFLYGIVFAFVMNIPMNYFRRHLPKRKGQERKILSAILSLSVVFIALAAVLFLFIPQLVHSISSLIMNISELSEELSQIVESVLLRFHMTSSQITQVQIKLSDFASQLILALETLLPDAKNLISTFVSGILDVMMGFVISVYLIFSKEKLLKKGKHLCYVFISEKWLNRLIKLYRLINKVFKNFINSQIIEAVIIGVMCYVGCLILQIPYASTCAIIIGCTNIIPYFGPFFGTAFCAILLLCESLSKSLLFIVFGTVIQQIESNLIYPHVVGNSVGLSPLLVLFTVIVGGRLFGIAGMIFGLPVMSIIYELLKDYIHTREAQLRTKENSA